MNRDLLKELGLEDEQIEKIMAEHGKTVNAIREENETLKGELGTASETLEGLKSDKITAEELKNQLEEYENKVKELQELREKEKVEYTLKRELEKAGALDTEYLIFKMGDLDNIKRDEDGNILDVEELISGLKTNHEALFKDEEEVKNIVEKKIPNEESKPLTVEDVKNMSAQEINENWEQIKDMNLGGDD